jgi:hypothetical protein
MAHRPVVMKRKLSLSAARPPTSRKAREVGHPELVYSTIQSESRYHRAGEVGHPPGRKLTYQEGVAAVKAVLGLL